MTTKTPKCPKGKALFKATTPDGQVVYRSSAREYTHALAVYRADRPEYTHTVTHVLKEGDALPEGAYDSHSPPSTRT